MATAKFAWIIADLLGLSTSFVFLFMSNLDIFQKAVIWLFVAGYLGVRLYFTIVFNNQKRRKNELDLLEQENRILRGIDADELKSP